VDDVTAGIALALACALATSVSFLLKHRGAVAAQPVEARLVIGGAALIPAPVRAAAKGPADGLVRAA
jgi:hypothetical protein